MLLLRSLTIKNFLSVGAITQAIRLDRDPVTLVLGHNLDTTVVDSEVTSRNGAGKTTMVNAVSYGLFGLPLTNIKKDNLINKINGKQMLVTIDFERDGHRYRVERGRKPAVFRFVVDNTEVSGGEVDESQGEGRNTQAAIEQVLGLSHLMFRHLIALNTHTEPFLKLPAAKQREIIEELLGITLLSQKADRLRELINGSAAKAIIGTKGEIRDEEFRVKTITDTNARIEKAIDELRLKSRAWRDRQQRKIADLEVRREEFAHIDFDAESALFDAVEEHARRVSDLEEKRRTAQFDLSRLEHDAARFLADADRHRSLVKPNPVKERLDGDLRRYQGDLEGIEKRLSGHLAAVERLTRDLATPDDLLCRTCHQKLKNTDHQAYVVERMQQDLQAETKLAEQHEQAREHILGLMRTVVEDHEHSQRQILTENERHRQDAAAAETAAVAIAGDLEARMVEVARLTEQAEANTPPAQSRFSSREQLWQTRSAVREFDRQLEQERAATDPYEDQIAAMAGTLQEISYAELNRLIRRRDHQEFLLKMLTDKNSFIRKSIIDQNLAFLNHRLNRNLERIGLPHEVQFLNDLSVEIRELGKELDFDNLSRGEQNRLILSLSWAFRDIFENINTPVNVSFVDELIDSGMDGQGVEMALEVLKQMAREHNKHIFLISHREELITRVNNVMTVMKENGFSTYQQDDTAEAA